MLLRSIADNTGASNVIVRPCVPETAPTVTNPEAAVADSAGLLTAITVDDDVQVVV
jgi:hypothetical protein